MNSVLLYLAYFFFFSFCGWALECFWCSVGESRKAGKFVFINRGFLSGPLCPIYGCAAVAMALTLGPFAHHNILVLFLLGMVVCDVIEYFTSFIMEKLFNARWWDYSERFMNLHGRICLQHTLIWGALSVVFMKLIQPAVSALFGLVPTHTFHIITYIALGIFALDLFITVVATIDIRSLSRKLKAMLSLTEDGDAQADPPQEVLDVGNAGYNDLSKRLTDFRDKVSSIPSPRLNIINHILREVPIFRRQISKQYAQLREEIPANMKTEFKELQNDLKSHFFLDFDDNMF